VKYAAIQFLCPTPASSTQTATWSLSKGLKIQIQINQIGPIMNVNPITNQEIK